ncbi:MAG: hypothetical protein WC263_02235 [Candidatus Micrarchaeia archaeon]
MVLIDEKLGKIIEKMEQSQASDPDAKGVILQLPVGQLVRTSREFEVYLPLMSMIAYTPEATERGNAIIKWVPGHPSLAVKGAGRYVAFNENDGKIDFGFDMWREPPTEAGCEKIVRSNMHTFVADGRASIYTLDAIRELPKKVQRRLERNLFDFMMKIGKESALYFELMMTAINGKVGIYPVQVSEVKNKLAGVPTWIFDSFMNMGKRLEDSTVKNSAQMSKMLKNPAEYAPTDDFERLKELYRVAMEDPHVVAAGFDVVGREKKRFGTIHWAPRGLADVVAFGDKSTLVCWDFGGLEVMSQAIEKGEVAMGGLVEIQSHRVNGTFWGHAHGACESQNIPALGGVEYVEKKLIGLMPGQDEGEKKELLWKGNLILKGDFLLDVDQAKPFGTLRVERIDSVERIE